MTDDPLDPVRAAFAGAEDVPPMPDASPPPDEPPPEDPGPPEEEPPEAVAARQPLNDVGNGARFAIYFGQDVLHVPRVGWFVWDGTRWAKDPDKLAVRGLGQEISQRMEAEVPYLPISGRDKALLAQKKALLDERADLRDDTDDDGAPSDPERLAEIEDTLRGIARVEERRRKQRGTYLSFAKSTGNSARIDNMALEATTRLSRPLEALDADPLAVNCQNGTLRFRVARNADGTKSATVELHPHVRDDLLTKCVGAPYDPMADAPEFDAFLERIMPDPAIRGFLARWFGLSLTGTPVQAFAFFFGDGANGKSVLVDLMARIYGDYSASVRIEALTGRNRRSGADATPELIPLVGARFVRSSEPEEGERLQEAKIKEITGGEPIQARQLHGDFFDLDPSFKVTISGNHKPEIRGGDEGIWRRVKLVPFTETIPPAERIPLPELIGKLMSDAPGILNWVVQGLLDYLENGLIEPEAVQVATAEYREESDPFGRFLNDCTEVTGRPDDYLPTAELVQAMNFWLLEQGGSAYKPRTIQMALKKKADTWRHPRDQRTFAPAKRSIAGYQGIRFADVFKKRMEDAPTDRDGNPVPGKKGSDQGGGDF